MTDNMATRVDVVLASSSLSPAAAVGGGLFFDILSRGAATATLAALMAVTSAAEMTVLPVAAALAVTLVRCYSNTDAQMTGQMGTTIMQRLPCSKNWKPYNIETKDIGIQASNAVLQLGVGYQLKV
jgi:hypothetical protein